PEAGTSSARTASPARSRVQLSCPLPWIPGSRAQVAPINLFSAHVRSQAGRCGSDDRETCTYWTLAPDTGHHPQRAIWTLFRVRHEGLVFRLVQDLRTDMRLAAEI